MSKYTAVLSKKAQKQLDKLPDNIAEPIFNAILELEENPRPAGNKKLKGRDGYKIRIGNYRVLYSIDDLIRIVEISGVKHRREAYEWFQQRNPVHS